MPRRQERESGSVHHPEVSDANDSCFGIHHGVGIARLPHCTRRGGMEDGVQTLPDDLEELGIRLDGGAGEILGSNQHRCHGLGGEQLSNALVACEGNLDVGRIGQPVGIDERLVGHAGRGDADVAARKRCDKSDDG